MKKIPLKRKMLYMCVCQVALILVLAFYLYYISVHVKYALARDWIIIVICVVFCSIGFTYLKLKATAKCPYCEKTFFVYDPNFCPHCGSDLTECESIKRDKKAK